MGLICGPTNRPEANYRKNGFRDIVLELTDGRGANIIYDPVGGDVFLESLRLKKYLLNIQNMALF